MLDEDFVQAPLTDAQEGENAGIRAYNSVVPEVNKVLKSAAPMRPRTHSPEAQKQIDEDNAILQQEKLNNTNIDGLRYTEPEKTFDADQFNQVDLQRNPSSLQDEIDSVILGKQNAPQIPMLPPLANASTGVSSANVPMITDVTKNARNVSVPKPGSTAQQALPQQGISNNLIDTKETIDSNLRGAEKYYDATKEGEEAKFNADEAKAVSQAQLLDQERKKIQDQLDENAYRESEARKLADDQMKQIGQIDPNRVWGNRSIWSKLALVAGAATQGSIGSAAGLQMMQDMVSKDIEAQKADMEAGVKRQGSLLELLKPFANNKIELMKMANTLGTKIAEEYGNAVKANVGKGASQAISLEKLATKYLHPLLTAKNINDANITKASDLEEKQHFHDETLKQKAVDLQIASERLKFDKQNMSAGDATRLEGTALMGISAKKMAQLENEKGFDPTAVKNAITSYMAGKGIPGSLSKEQQEYVMNYINYFSYERQALTGAAASDKEEDRIKLMVAPDRTFSKDAIKLYQKQRANIVNSRINALNAPALLRAKNIPELQEFSVNRGALKTPSKGR